MTIVAQINPFDFFVDAAGAALDLGRIYIGEPNKDPRIFPVAIYYDQDLKIPAANPLVTSNGYIYRNGTPAFLYINGNYSVMVLDKAGRQVYYVADFLLSGNGGAVSLGDLASTTDFTKGISIIPTAARVVSNIAALRALPKVGGSTVVYVAGYYARGDGGGGNYYLDAADTLSSDNGGPVIVATDGGRWKLCSTSPLTARQYGAKGDGTTDDTASLQKFLANGGARRLNSGTFKIATPLVIDYSVAMENGVGTGFPGFVSKRYDVMGEAEGNSIIIAPPSDFALILKGSYPITQDSSGFDQVGNLTITNPVRTTPNIDNSGGSGLFIQSKAFTKVSRIFAQNLATGFHFDGVLTSRFEQLVASGCYTGFKSKNVNGFSGPNAIEWSECRAANTFSNGFDIDVGAATHLNNLVAEGCGTMGTPSCGMLLTAQADQIGGNIVMTTPYLELNAGESDLYINNKSTSPLIVTINGGVFARAGVPAGQPDHYTKTNIHAHSDGGGQVIVLLKGVTFLSVAGYKPDPSRPFWLADANCMVIPDRFCRYNETVSLPPNGNRFVSSVPVVLDVNGGVIGGTTGTLTCNRTATGVYVCTSVGLPFGKSVTDYAVVANPADSSATGLSSAQFIRVQPISATQFALNVYSGNTPVNSPISLVIARAEYAE